MWLPSIHWPQVWYTSVRDQMLYGLNISKNVYSKTELNVFTISRLPEFTFLEVTHET